VELRNWSRYHLGNLLLVVGGCLLPKLDLMLLLIASKLVLWPKVILKIFRLDYGDTFSPMAKMATVLLFIAMVTL